jgi:hypothetical protein
MQADKWCDLSQGNETIIYESLYLIIFNNKVASYQKRDYFNIRKGIILYGYSCQRKPDLLGNTAR